MTKLNLEDGIDSEEAAKLSVAVIILIVLGVLGAIWLGSYMVKAVYEVLFGY